MGGISPYAKRRIYTMGAIIIGNEDKIQNRQKQGTES